MRFPRPLDAFVERLAWVDVWRVENRGLRARARIFASLSVSALRALCDGCSRVWNTCCGVDAGIGARAKRIARVAALRAVRRGGFAAPPPHKSAVRGSLRARRIPWRLPLSSRCIRFIIALQRMDVVAACLGGGSRRFAPRDGRGARARRAARAPPRAVAHSGEAFYFQQGARWPFARHG